MDTSNTGFTKSSPFGDFRGQVTQIAEIIGNLAKIVATVSIVLGVALLVNYLQNQNAPVPSFSTSLGALLEIFASTFVFFTIVATSLFVTPAFSTLSTKSPSSSPIKSAKLSFQDYASDFGLFIFAELALLVLFLYVIRTFFNKNIIWPIAFLVAEVAVPLTVNSLVRCRNNWGEFFLANVFSAIWLLTATQIILIFTPSIESHVSEQATASYIITALAVVMLLHFCITSWIRTWRAVIGVYVLVSGILLVVYPGASVLCAGALRFLGIGGNMPVTILVKTMHPGDTVAAATPISGCLILDVGEELLIRPTTRIEDCRIRRNFSLIHPQRPYESIERYTQTDVLKISEFSETTCGTVDGLPGCSEPPH